MRIRDEETNRTEPKVNRKDFKMALVKITIDEAIVQERQATTTTTTSEQEKKMDRCIRGLSVDSPHSECYSLGHPLLGLIGMHRS